MRTIVITLIAFFTITNLATSKTDKYSFAKTESAKVIVMVNTASWCPTCRTNGQRVKESVLAQYIENKKYHIVVNDLSNKSSKAESKEKCEKAGIAEVAKKNKATGVIYFIHSETKVVLTKISVAKSTDEIIKVFDEALAKI